MNHLTSKIKVKPTHREDCLERAVLIAMARLNISVFHVERRDFVSPSIAQSVVALLDRGHVTIHVDWVKEEALVDLALYNEKVNLAKGLNAIVEVLEGRRLGTGYGTR